MSGFAPCDGAFRHVVRIDVDQLHHPVAVRARGGGKQVDLRRAHDVHCLVERRGRPADDVRAIRDEALVVDQPRLPLVGRPC